MLGGETEQGEGKLFCKLFIAHHLQHVDWWENSHLLNPEVESSGLKMALNTKINAKYPAHSLKVFGSTMELLCLPYLPTHMDGSGALQQ